MLEESFKKILVCSDLDTMGFAEKLSNRDL